MSANIKLRIKAYFFNQINRLSAKRLFTTLKFKNLWVLSLRGVWIFLMKHGERRTFGTSIEYWKQKIQNTPSGWGSFGLRPKSYQATQCSERGFTIVELNMTIGLMALLSIGFMAIFTNYLVINTRLNTSIEMTSGSQILLRTMVEELRYGAGVRQTNTIIDPNGPSGGWNTGNTNFVIITTVPAVNSSNEYIIDTSTGSPYLNEFVYFKEDALLYKRTLAHPGATGNRLKTSCPASLATPSCPADRKLVENLSSMAFTLYDQDNATTTAPNLARSVKIDLTLSKDTFGSPMTFDNSIRITLRNVF